MDRKLTLDEAREWVKNASRLAYLGLTTNLEQQPVAAAEEGCTQDRYVVRVTTDQHCPDQRTGIYTVSSFALPLDAFPIEEDRLRTNWAAMMIGLLGKALQHEELHNRAEVFKRPEDPLECPRCKSEMGAYTFDGHTPVINADFCPVCRIIWPTALANGDRAVDGRTIEGMLNRSGVRPYNVVFTAKLNGERKPLLQSHLRATKDDIERLCEMMDMVAIPVGGHIDILDDPPEATDGKVDPKGDQPSP
jgi:hypothetical protein